MITLVISTSLAILLAGLASVAVQGGGIIANAVSNSKTNKRNEELTKEQNEWNRQQVLDERAYNNPQLAIQRLKDAGLNPNLAYGDVNSQVDGSAVGNAPTMQALDTSPFASNFTSTTDSVMQAVNNKRMLDIEQQNADSRGKEVDSVVRYNDAAIISFGYQNRLNDAQTLKVKTQIDQIGKSIEEMNERIKLIKSQASLTDVQKRLAAAEAFIKDVQGRYSESYWQSYISSLDASSKNLLSQARLNARTLYEAQQTFSLRLSEQIYGVSLKRQEMHLNNIRASQEVERLIGLQLNNGQMRLDLDMKNWDFINKKSDYERRHLTPGQNNFLYSKYNIGAIPLRFANQLIGDLGASISLFGPKL